MKILIVEDDADLADSIKRLLEKEGHIVDLAPSMSIGKAAVLDHKYGVILLDRLLPDGEGTDLIRYVRDKNLPLRFLILSALSSLNKRIEGLNLGADDYIVKPFEPAELLARIRAAERRPLPELSRILKLGKLRLNCETKNFRIDGKTIVLPRREMTVLELLLNKADRVVTRETIEAAMYGYDDEIQSNTLESHISRLRKKLTKMDARVTIHTIRGVGYHMTEKQ